MPERPGARGLHEAAVDLAQRSRGLVHVGPSGSGRFVELDLQHAASGGSVEPVNDAATGFIEQRHRDATSGRFQHPSEVTVS